jgi:hypothetical protein
LQVCKYQVAILGGEVHLNLDYIKQHFKHLLVLILVIILVDIGFTSCDTGTTVVQQNCQSQLCFTGNFVNAIVCIDEQKPIELKTPSRGTESLKNYYEVSPGRHRLVIYKEGEVVIDRFIFVHQNMTKEIKIP